MPNGHRTWPDTTAEAVGCITALYDLGGDEAVLDHLAGERDWKNADKRSLMLMDQWGRVQTRCEVTEYAPKIEKAISDVRKSIDERDLDNYIDSSSNFSKSMNNLIREKIVPRLG